MGELRLPVIPRMPAEVNREVKRAFDEIRGWAASMKSANSTSGADGVSIDGKGITIEAGEGYEDERALIFQNAGIQVGCLYYDIASDETLNGMVLRNYDATRGIKIMSGTAINQGGSIQVYGCNNANYPGQMFCNIGGAGAVGKFYVRHYNGSSWNPMLVGDYAARFTLGGDINWSAGQNCLGIVHSPSIPNNINNSVVLFAGLDNTHECLKMVNGNGSIVSLFQGVAIPDLIGSETLAQVIAKFNTFLQSYRAHGLIA